MITISIEGTTLPLADARPDWIAQQINRRRADGRPVCVSVSIQTDDVNVRLTTPECNGVGGGRMPNAREQRLLDLWERAGLRKGDYSAGDLISFLRRLETIL